MSRVDREIAKRIANCPEHGESLLGPLGCSQCLAVMQGPLPASAEDRAKEIERWGALCLTVPFDVLHKRMERLCGRPVWTHEFAWPAELAAEVRRGATIEDPATHAIGKLREHRPDLPVIVVALSSPEGT